MATATDGQTFSQDRAELLTEADYRTDLFSTGRAPVSDYGTDLFAALSTIREEPRCGSSREHAPHNGTGLFAMSCG